MNEKCPLCKHKLYKAGKIKIMGSEGKYIDVDVIYCKEKTCNYRGTKEIKPLERKLEIEAIDYVKSILQRQINDNKEMIYEEQDKREKKLMKYEIEVMRELIKYLKVKKEGLDE